MGGGLAVVEAGSLFRFPAGKIRQVNGEESVGLYPWIIKWCHFGVNEIAWIARARRAQLIVGLLNI